MNNYLTYWEICIRKLAYAYKCCSDANSSTLDPNADIDNIISALRSDTFCIEESEKTYQIIKELYVYFCATENLRPGKIKEISYSQMAHNIEKLKFIIRPFPQVNDSAIKRTFKYMALIYIHRYELCQAGIDINIQAPKPPSYKFESESIDSKRKWYWNEEFIMAEL